MQPLSAGVVLMRTKSYDNKYYENQPTPSHLTQHIIRPWGTARYRSNGANKQILCDPDVANLFWIMLERRRQLLFFLVITNLKILELHEHPKWRRLLWSWSHGTRHTAAQLTFFNFSISVRKIARSSALFTYFKSSIMFFAASKTLFTRENKIRPLVTIQWQRHKLAF